MARNSRWFTPSLPEPDPVSQFHSFVIRTTALGILARSHIVSKQQTVRRRCGSVYDELRTQLASVFPRWIVLLFVDSIPATQLARVLSRLTPFTCPSDLRSALLFLSSRFPARLFPSGRLCDFVFVPDSMCSSSTKGKIRLCGNLFLPRPAPFACPKGTRTLLTSSAFCNGFRLGPPWSPPRLSFLGELPFAMLEKLHLPQPFLRRFKGLIGTAEIFALA